MRIKHHELLALMHPFFATPKKHKTIHQEGLNPERAGWYSLDDHANEEDIQGLRQRNEEFLTKRAEGRDRITMMLKKKKGKERPLNPVLLDRLRKIIQQAKAKGIHCFFVTFPPTFVTLPDDILNDSELREHFIQLSRPERFPELYETRAFFDEGHLTIGGVSA